MEKRRGVSFEVVAMFLAVCMLMTVFDARQAGAKQPLSNGYFDHVARSRSIDRSELAKMTTTLEGFSLFIWFPDSITAQANGHPFAYITDQDWANWDAWNTKNTYGTNGIWITYADFLNIQDLSGLVSRLVVANIKFIYLETCGWFKGNHVLTYLFDDAMLQNFIDYVHTHSSMKVIAWGVTPSVDISTSAFRQQMMNEIVTCMNKGFDGWNDDMEIWTGTNQDLVDYWNLMGQTLKSVGKQSSVDLAVWLIDSIGAHVTVDYIVLMDYFDKPPPLTDLTGYLDSALANCPSPVICGLFVQQSSPTLTEQEATIDNRYLSSSNDVGIAAYAVVKAVVGRGYALGMEVKILNYGLYDENFLVTVYANSSTAVTQGVELARSSSIIITLTWNTTGFAYGNYTISAYVWPVPGETNTANNNLTAGCVMVTMVGDLTGGTSSPWDFVPDGKCDGKDIVIVAKCFGSAPGAQPPEIWNPNCDVNDDGKVDGKDIAIVARHFGEHYP